MGTLLSDLKQRGCIHDVSNYEGLNNLLESQKTTFYGGFDPTASSLHVGSMLPLLLMRKLQRAGHRAIALVGSATGLIGDPSGKSEERTLLDKEKIEENVAGISAQIGLFLEAQGSNPFLLVQNYDWLGKLHYVDFLRDVGKHFTVNAMIAKESVRARLESREQGISYTEFSYMLLQAYDYYHLYREYQCRLQVGGSDQWGNITAGMELIRRKIPEYNEVFGLTFPLLTTSSGQKFGKTEKGTVWLDAARTSPYLFYQFWLNTADADVMRYLSLFTDVSGDELNELSEKLVRNPEERAPQKALAAAVTAVVHGKMELDKALTASKVLFGGTIENIDADTLLEIFSDVPSTLIAAEEMQQEVPIQDLLVRGGAAASKGAAKRLIEGGGIALNNERISDSRLAVGRDRFVQGKVLVIRSGKRNYYLLRIAD